MSTLEYARNFEFKGFEKAFFEEVVIFFRMRDQDATLQDCIGGFFLEEFPVFEDGGRKDAFHYLLGVNQGDWQEGDVEEDERVFFLDSFCGVEFRGRAHGAALGAGGAWSTLS